MPKPTVRHALRAALLTLTTGLLLPGALAAQGAASASLPSTVHVPSLEALRSGPSGDAVPRSAARLRAAAAGPDLTSRAVPELRLPELAADGARHPMVRVGTPAVMGRDPAAAEPPAVLDAVFLLAGPAGADENDARESLGGLGDVLPRELCRDLVELKARIRRYRSVLFGHRGILRWGELDGSKEISRLRLNLQADPHPGVRVTLVTH